MKKSCQRHAHIIARRLIHPRYHVLRAIGNDISPTRFSAWARHVRAKPSSFFPPPSITSARPSPAAATGLLTEKMRRDETRLLRPRRFASPMRVQPARDFQRFPAILAHHRLDLRGRRARIIPGPKKLDPRHRLLYRAWECRRASPLARRADIISYSSLLRILQQLPVQAHRARKSSNYHGILNVGDPG